MYGIRVNEGDRETYTLYDSGKESSFTINPKRGGIITEFKTRDFGHILYMNEEIYKDPLKYIRGGIPVLFPMTGRLSGDTYKLQGVEYSMPVHGLVRNYPWEIRDTSFTDSATIVVGLKSNEEMKKAFPFSFDVEFTYTLKGNTLTLSQRFTNFSRQDMPVSFGFHPYFKVMDKKTAAVDLAASSYKDMVSGRIVSGQEKPDFTKDQETGCLYLEVKNQKARLRADDRCIDLSFDKNYRHILLWSLPGEDFICVEPWTAKPDALNSKEELIYIRPGETLRSFMEITVYKGENQQERTGTVC